MYDHNKQYRCDIIRGKSQSLMDDLLSAYAKVIDEICPCAHDLFEDKYNEAFARYLPEDNRVKKTFDNHRTEISGKLFGMYYFADDGVVYESERTQKYLFDNDQPAFFKDVCYKMQFPNGMQKTSPTVIERVRDGICIRPNAFLLRFLQIAKTANVGVTKKMIGYYILNSLDVLTGVATPYEVLETLAYDINHGISRQIHAIDENGNEKADSYKYQHINEQLNYLELANLIRFVDNPAGNNDRIIILNPLEEPAIDLFASKWDTKPSFDVASFDLTTVEKRKSFQYAWDEYYARISDVSSHFNTDVNALAFTAEQQERGKDFGGQDEKADQINLVAFGDEGEALVFEYEKKRVAAYNTRLANKVLSLGKTKGLGYDIQSVIAEPGEMDEFVKYIEVKSTKRLTCPSTSDNLWIDTLNITRNEWIAARQHGAFYSIYRVYFTRSGVSAFILSNVASKMDDGRMQTTPMTYRVDFSNSSIDSTIELQLA